MKFEMPLPYLLVMLYYLCMRSKKHLHAPVAPNHGSRFGAQFVYPIPLKKVDPERVVAGAIAPKLRGRFAWSLRKEIFFGIAGVLILGAAGLVFVNSVLARSAQLAPDTTTRPSAVRGMRNHTLHVYGDGTARTATFDFYGDAKVTQSFVTDSRGYYTEALTSASKGVSIYLDMATPVERNSPGACVGGAVPSSIRVNVRGNEQLFCHSQHETQGGAMLESTIVPVGDHYIRLSFILNDVSNKATVLDGLSIAISTLRIVR